MKILTDGAGYEWRVRGNLMQVSVERRSPLSDKNEGNVRVWKAMSHHNRLDHALSWLLDQLVRMGLDDTEAEDFVSLVGAMRAKIQEVTDAWREEISKSTYERSFQ